MKIHPLADLFPSMDDAAFQQLKQDISANGILEPIWLYKSAVIDGRHRYRAADELGIDCPTREYKGNDPLGFVISLNLKRRHLNESQRALVAARIANMQKGDNQHTSIDAPSPISQAAAAEMMNVGTATLQRAKRVIEDADTDTIQQIERGNLTVTRALGEIKRQKNATLPKLKTPDNLFDVIVIDPPWPMEKIERDVRPNQAAFDYPTMSLEEIANLKLPSADDCHLFCWTTQKFLPPTLDIIKQWGFKYVLTMVWHKPGGFQPIGLPQYNCEFILYARKGSPKFSDTKSFPTCFNAPRQEHSVKPQEFYDTIARVTDGNRIDMFSRQHRKGFSGWGNQHGTLP